jgi:4-hydroxy-tetrahydrodipicolinate reductase
MTKKVTIITIVGTGRMGHALTCCAKNIPEIKVLGQIGRERECIPTSDLIRLSDVVIDFSVHTATCEIVNLCVEHNKPLVIGTTGHTDAEGSEITARGSKIPMVWSSNYSVGVNLLFWLTSKATEILGRRFDVEIIELHHRLKKDAPSGTAKTLASIVARVRGQLISEVTRNGRKGIIGARSSSEIGIHSLRGGDVVGDHTVLFATDGERLELTHKASSRDTFAKGALRAAQWVTEQKPGIYSMQEVLQLPG